MKRNVTNKMLLVVLALCMLMMLLLPACKGDSGNPSDTKAPETTGTPETSEPKQPEKKPMQVYWNVERAQYADKAREKGADGNYSVKLALAGRLETVKIKGDEALIKKLDSLDVLCLEMDENKVATAVKTVEEMGGAIVAEAAYVESYSNTLLKVNDAADFSGKSQQLNIGFSTYIVDVTSANVQMLYSLYKLDKVMVVADETGAINNVFLYGPSEVRVGKDAYCEHCKQEVHWDAWAEKYSLPVTSSGHYYLVDDVVADKQQSIAGNVELIIDLNGKTITRAGGREVEGTGRVIALFEEGSYLALLDTSEAKTGKVKMVGDVYAHGGGIWLRYGNFDLFSGTIDGTGIVNTASGAVIHVSKGYKFNMYGGTILGATTKSAFEEEKNSSGGYGGSVYVDGEFNMQGGTIEGGIANATEFDGETPKGKGGNVYVTKNGVFTMSGGEIKGGTADTEGPDLYVSEGGTFTQTGGTIAQLQK